MKVILLQNIKGIGRMGDIKDVSDGYGRNFLLAKKLGKLANEGTIKEAEVLKKKAEVETKVAQDKAKEVAEKVKDVALLKNQVKQVSFLPLWARKKSPKSYQKPLVLKLSRI